MTVDYSQYTLKELEQTTWLDLAKADPKTLKVRLQGLWKESIGQPQITYTGKIDIDYEEILALDPDDAFFHPVGTRNDSQSYSLHQGCADNMMGIHQFPKDHNINKKLSEKFDLTQVGSQLFLQRPANLVGVHYDKYSRHTADGEYFNGLINEKVGDTLTQQIYRGVVFCTDWEIGQVFLSGTEAITNWKQGDTYTFPWYMPHGSANASDKERYLIRFLGEKK